MKSKIKCLICSNLVLGKQAKKYCSHKCRLAGLHLSIRKYPDKFCLICNKKISRKHIKINKTCSMKCFSIYAKNNWKKGKSHHRFKGNPYPDGNGYIRIYNFYNSKKRNNSVHRIVMEKVIGRPLTKKEIVHHINGDKNDNRPENLEVMSRSLHTKIHAQDLLRLRWNKPSLLIKKSPCKQGKEVV